MNEKVKAVLIISAKHAVNALLTNGQLAILFPQVFHLHNWAGFGHILEVALATIASREAMVWGPKLVAWSMSGLNMGNGGAPKP